MNVIADHKALAEETSINLNTLWKCLIMTEFVNNFNSIGIQSQWSWLLASRTLHNTRPTGFLHSHTSETHFVIETCRGGGSSLVKLLSVGHVRGGERVNPPPPPPSPQLLYSGQEWRQIFSSIISRLRIVTGWQKHSYGGGVEMLFWISCMLTLIVLSLGNPSDISLWTHCQ